MPIYINNNIPPNPQNFQRPPLSNKYIIYTVHFTQRLAVDVGRPQQPRHRNNPVSAYKEPRMQENCLNKFRSIVSEVSSLVCKPVHCTLCIVSYLKLDIFLDFLFSGSNLCAEFLIMSVASILALHEVRNGY